MKFSLTSRGQVSAPALWGKLPSHADYLQHRVKAGELPAWQRWLVEALPSSSAVGSRTGAAARLTLDPPPSGRKSIPIAFVLPPGTLSFAPRQFLFGMLVRSRDRLGREHPMLVYQRASARWLQGVFDASPARAADACQHWPFALARLLARHAQDDGAAAAGLRPHSLPEMTERLWSLFAPGLLEQLNLRRHAPPASEVHGLLEQAPPMERDAAAALLGMACPPWADWPERLWAPQPRPAFWRHDSLGGYVDASVHLHELWERH